MPAIAVKYFVNDDGIICNTTSEPIGCKFVFKSFSGRSEVWIVSRRSGEVLGEFALWDSISDLEAAGVTA